jgi:hypothetical protein
MKIVLAAAVAAANLGASGAGAALLQFEITGAYVASFQLDTDNQADPSYALFRDVSGTFQGVADGSVTITFYDGFDGGSLSIADSAGAAPFAGPFVLNGFGEQIFQGSGTVPTFAPGTFQVFTSPYKATRFPDMDTPPDQFGLATLTIREVGAAVPEPISWAMMIAGVGFAGGAMRWRKAPKQANSFVEAAHA